MLHVHFLTFFSLGTFYSSSIRGVLFVLSLVSPYLYLVYLKRFWRLHTYISASLNSTVSLNVINMELRHQLMHCHCIQTITSLVPLCVFLVFDRCVPYISDFFFYNSNSSMTNMALYKTYKKYISFQNVFRHKFLIMTSQFGQ